MRTISLFLRTILLFFSLSFAYADSNLKNLEQKISDSVITTKITAKFTKNRNLNPLKIYVSTKEGVVILRGHVKDRQAFVDALTLAVNTKGVREVDTEGLAIKQVNTAFTDAYLTARVEAAILRAKVFDDPTIPLVGINATTTNGTVTLTGTLKRKQAISAIIKRVSAIRSVKKIISRLKIAKEANDPPKLV
jgi:hyperosmotically inducible protein